MVDVAQLVRAPDCGSGGRRFESGYPPHPSLEELWMASHLKIESEGHPRRRTLSRAYEKYLKSGSPRTFAQMLLW
jgi:hypothetical protein